MTHLAKALKRLRQLRQMEYTITARAAIRDDLGQPANSLHSRRRAVAWAFDELCEKYQVDPAAIDRAIAEFCITHQYPDAYNTQEVRP